MIDLYVHAPRVNKLQKTGKGFKKLPNGKRAPAVERPAWLNANQRLNHHQKGKYTALWREKAASAAEEWHTPKLGDAKLFCIASINLPREVSYDSQNYYPSAKAAIDGIIGDYGMLNDDDNDHLVGPLCVKGVKSPNGFGGIHFMFFDTRDFPDQQNLTAILNRL